MLKTVNSFDIFDTLIGRLHGSPDTIFDIVSKKLNYPDFKDVRKLAERKSSGGWDDIWKKFQDITSISESRVEEIKNLEWLTEKENSFPITTNVVLLRPKDILISDMYLKEEMVRELLGLHSITSYDRIYISPSGKRNGYIWSAIKQDGYRISLHTGDNIESDIFSAKKHNIATSYFDPSYNKQEIFLFNNNKKDLANLLRIIRLNNLYTRMNENKAVIWNILSSVLPIAIIIFDRDFSASNQIKLPEYYHSYKNNFDYFVGEHQQLVQEMTAMTNFYSDKLGIEREKYIKLDDDLLFYIEKYGEVLPNDIL